MQVCNRACNGAVRQCRLAVLYSDHIHTQRALAAVFHAAQTHRVADDAHALRHELKRRAHHSRVNVDAVTDELTADVFVVEHRAHDTRCTVCKAGHRVIQMRRMGYALFERVHRAVVIRCGVRNGNGAELRGFLYKIAAHVALGRNVHKLDDAAAGIVILLKHVVIRRLDELVALRALFLRRDERALKVHADNLRAFLVVHAGANRLKRFQDLRIGNGHRGRAEGRDTLRQQELRHIAQALCVAVAGICTRAAVHVNVHKSRHNGVARAVHNEVFLFVRQRILKAHDLAVFDLDICLAQAEFVVQYVCVDQKHGKNSSPLRQNRSFLFNTSIRLQQAQQNEQRHARHAKHSGYRHAEPADGNIHSGVRRRKIQNRQRQNAQHCRADEPFDSPHTLSPIFILSEKLMMQGNFSYLKCRVSLYPARSLPCRSQRRRKPR